MNTNEARAATPTHLWIVGVVSLLWAAMGAADYSMSAYGGADYIRSSGMGEEAVVWFEGVPAWMTAAWAFGVWGAVAGSILLLLRSRHAVPAFAASLAGVLAMTVGVMAVHRYPAAMVTPAGTMFEWTIKLVAVVLLWYAWRMRRNGVLR